MVVVLQRVKTSIVSIHGEVVASINDGILVLIGIVAEDQHEDIEWVANKILNLRIFSDENQKMNLSVRDISGEIMVVSQFTLQASTKKGNRPSYIHAAKPDISLPIYKDFINYLTNHSNLKIESGIFGADMEVALVNDGPVTIIIDSKNRI